MVDDYTLSNISLVLDKLTRLLLEIKHLKTAYLLTIAKYFGFEKSAQKIVLADGILQITLQLLFWCAKNRQF